MRENLELIFQDLYEEAKKAIPKPKVEAWCDA